MPLEPIKSFHLKKPHSDSQLSFKSNQSPTGSARRTSQQAKAYGFPNPEPSINKPQKTFSVVLNGSAVKIEKPKATKSVKIITSKEKILKSSTTLTELYVTPGSSFRESVSNRTMKSPTQFVRQGSLDMKSYSPGIKTSGGETPTSFSLKSVRPNELVAILQSKNEEINRLKTNIQDLQVLLSLKKSNDSKMEKLEEMKHNINLKDNVIEVYEKLLMLCSGKAPYTLKMLSTEGGEDVPKQGTSSTSIKLNSVKVASMAEAQSNNCSIASLLPKSMNLTSSPTPGDRNESPLHLKIVEQDSQVGKGESLSPTYRLTTKGGSHIIQKIKVKSESMVKVKVVPDKYRAEARLFRERGDLALKSGLSKSLSPSMDLERPRVKIEIENNTEIRNQDSSCSKEYGLGGGHSPKSSIGRFLLKQNPEVSLEKDLNRLVERFGSAFKNMEEKNKALIKKTEFMKKKIEEYEMNKQHEEKKLE